MHRYDVSLSFSARWEGIISLVRKLPRLEGKGDEADAINPHSFANPVACLLLLTAEPENSAQEPICAAADRQIRTKVSHWGPEMKLACWTVRFYLFVYPGVSTSYRVSIRPSNVRKALIPTSVISRALPRQTSASEGCIWPSQPSSKLATDSRLQISSRCTRRSQRARSDLKDLVSMYYKLVEYLVWRRWVKWKRLSFELNTSEKTEEQRALDIQRLEVA